MGGFGGGSAKYNDVWRSTDQGASWMPMAVSADWKSRCCATAVALSNDSIVLMGGFDKTCNFNDVWRSTDQGASWASVTSSAIWTARDSFPGVVLSNDSIILLGGRGLTPQCSTTTTIFDDVWRSTDRGASWEAVTSMARWPARFGHAAVVLANDSIVIMGGRDSNNYFGDVWRSTDGGATWTLVTGSPGWSARRFHSAVALSDDSIILMGGNTEFSNNLGDVWRSTDRGDSWTQVTSSAGWGPRASHAAVVLAADFVVLMGGEPDYNDDNTIRNDVWSTICAPGSYNDGLCFPCPAGKFQPLSGRAACNACPPGKYGNEQGLASEYTACSQLCPRGFHGNATGAASAAEGCTLCPPGWFGPSQGGPDVTACVPCPRGTYASAPPTTAFADCLPCPFGTYGALSGLSSPDKCTPCPLGAVTKANGSIVVEDCLLCPPGEYAASTTSTGGESLCDQCPAGTWSSERGAQSVANCTACPLGTHSKQVGATAPSTCETCPRAKFLNVSGAVTCTPCPNGHITLSVGATEAGNCSACAAGKYLEGVVCVQCPPGKASAAEAATDSSTCKACAPGTYAPDAGMAVCALCGPGEYLAAPGGVSETQCLRCDQGKYSNASGLATCFECPAGTTTPARGAKNASDCVSCEYGAYLDGVVCVQCPPGKASAAEAAADSSTCQDCAPGSYALSPGTDVCTPCVAGKYLPVSGGVSAAQCLECPVGNYSSAPCPPRSSTAAPGATSLMECQPCELGQYLQDARCFDCPSGTYSNSSIAASVDDCTLCPTGSYAASAGSIHCSLCPPGKASAADGATRLSSCVKCAIGTYADRAGLAECVECPAGTRSLERGANSSDTCEQCEAGTYEQGGTCIPCSPGTASNATGAAGSGSCVTCPAGTYAGGGATACEQCPVGTYRTDQAATALAQCLKCPAGTFSPMSAATSEATCVKCPAGRASGVEGAASSADCSLCPAGTYAEAGSATCFNCTQGTYSGEKGLQRLQDCTACPQGMYGVAAGQSNASNACAPCPAGTAGRRARMASVDECTACDGGLVTLEPGQVSCARCPANRYAGADAKSCIRCPTWAVLSELRDACEQPCAKGQHPNVDQSACAACPPGTFAAKANTTECAPCPPGTFTDGSGAAQCKPCPAGEFNPLMNQPACAACVGQGRSTRETGAAKEDACLCAADVYSLDVGAATSDCSACPVHAVCPALGAPPEPAPGYWVDVLDPAAPIDVMVPCIPAEACSGGSQLRVNATAQCLVAMRSGSPKQRSRWCPAELSNATLASLAVEASEQHCTAAYAGERCSMCAPGYYRFSGACYSCADQATATIAVAGSAVVAGLLLVWLLSRLRVSLAPFTIAVDFFQILGRQAAVNIAWGSASESTLSWTNAFDFNVELLAPECVVAVDYAVTWAAVMAVPLVAVMAMGAVHLFRWLALSASSRDNAHRFLPRLLLLCQLVYMVLVQKALEALDCVTLPSGKQVLEASPEVTCWEGRHVTLAVGGVLALVVYVAGIPLLFAAALYAAGRRGGTWNEAVAPIAARFKNEHRWWMLVVMGRKFLLAATMTLNTTRPGFQLAFAASILMVAIMLHARERPYRHLLLKAGNKKSQTVRRQSDLRRWELWTTDANLLESVALVASFVVVFGATFFLNGNTAVSDGTLQPWAMAWVDAGVATTVVGSTAFVVAIVVASTVLARRADVRKVRLSRQASTLERSWRRGSSMLRDNPMWKADSRPAVGLSAMRGHPHGAILGPRKPTGLELDEK